MTQARLRTGQIGEQLAGEHLRGSGMSVIARNPRTRAGEIDIICLDCGTLVFVEVKTMHLGTRQGPERPELAVGPRKQMQIRRLARAWLAENENGPSRYTAIRFDVVGVLLDGAGRAAVINHIPDAF